MTDESKDVQSATAASEAGKALAKLGASKGGEARAHSLSPEQRSQIARNAIMARWQKAGKAIAVVKATHEGPLQIGDLAMECAVLADGTRVLSQRGFARAIGASKPMSMTRRGAGNLPSFLSAANLKPFIREDLMAAAKPIPYIPLHGGAPAYGIKAEAIPLICKVWLEAEDNEQLHKSQQRLARQADIIIRGLATVGIVALVDEATGYQEDRERNALARILEAYIAKELRPWIHTFPAEYYRQVYRLLNWEYPPIKNKMPKYVGKLTTDVVYSRLPYGVLDELQRRTPRDDKGRLKWHYHRQLTEDIGHPKLREHLGAVIALMRISPDWSHFYSLLNQYYPRTNPKLPLWEQAAANN